MFYSLSLHLQKVFYIAVNVIGTKCVAVASKHLASQFPATNTPGAAEFQLDAVQRLVQLTLQAQLT